MFTSYIWNFEWDDRRPQIFWWMMYIHRLPALKSSLISYAWNPMLLLKALVFQKFPLMLALMILSETATTATIRSWRIWMKSVALVSANTSAAPRPASLSRTKTGSCVTILRSMEWGSTIHLGLRTAAIAQQSCACLAWKLCSANQQTEQVIFSMKWF